MRNRPFEFLFVVMAVAIYVGYIRPNTVESTSQTTVELAADAVTFELPTADGDSFVYQADGQRWTFLTLTAIGCADCVNHQATDREAMRRVEKLGGRSLALLLFGDSKRLAGFAQTHPSGAEQTLLDFGGEVGVKQLRGSDSQRWLLLAPDGSLVWQGPPDLEQLEAQLAGEVL